MENRGSTETGLIVGAIGGTALGVALATLLAAKPAEAATPDEKLNYLIELLTALIPVLAEVAEGQAALNQSLQQWLAAQGIEPGVEVSVSTPWFAQEPVEIFDREVRETAITLDCDKMANWTKGKRMVFKVESSLDQAVNFQVVGNIEDSMQLATNINAALPVAANGNITAGLAWDDWHPFVGARIIVGAAPTTGRLKVEYSIQE
ncbi:hypothetical protein ES703_124320 [subsurface metagenome]